MNYVYVIMYLTATKLLYCNLISDCWFYLMEATENITYYLRYLLKVAA